MKTLYLVRHAKAVEKTTCAEDFNRVLTAKGIADSIELGKRLKKMRIRPDRIISSPAPRALQTAKIVQEYINYRREVVLNKKIYDSSLTALLGIVKKTDEEIKELMLAGHNPAFYELLHYLCKTDIEKFPKAAAAGIRLKKKWSEVSPHCGKLLFLKKG